MNRSIRCHLASAGLFLLQLAQVAAAGKPDCAIPSTSVLIEPQVADPSSTFGRAVAIDGDWLAIGVRGDAATAGRVEIFRQSDEGWLPHQILVPSDGVVNDRFGHALSMRDEALLIGAQRGNGAVPTSGTAYVFRLIDGAWQEEAKLFVDDGKALDSFGSDVALEGETALIGVPSRDGFGFNSGAAYVFEGRDGTWELAATLLAEDGAAHDLFGQCVDLDGGSGVVGAPFHGPGSVHIFERIDGEWTQTDVLSPPDSLYPGAGGVFGQTVALRGETLLVNAYFGGGPLHALLAYERAGDTWSNPRLAVSPGGLVFVSHTLMLAPNGDVAAWASLLYAGASVAILHRDDAGWYSEQHVLPPDAFPNTDSPAAVSFDGANLVMGRAGKAFVAKLPPRDRDLDGLDDECEITSGLAEDCDDDGVIDDLQRSYRYMADRPGEPIDTFLVLSYPGHILVMNHFAVTGTADTVASIGLASPGIYGITAALQATAAIYLDPNGDGHPADAVLLSAQPVNVCPYIPVGLHDVRIAPVEVGPVGTSFFVGLLMEVAAGQPFAGVDLELPHRQVSWYVASSNPIDLRDLSVNVPMPLDVNGEQLQSWIATIRANLSDCDGSNRLDSCEIAEGALDDFDGNGWPDGCEAPLADLDGDGSVTTADVGLLLAAWGPCPTTPSDCAADLDGDGVVDGGDLALMLSTWCA